MYEGRDFGITEIQKCECQLKHSVIEFEPQHAI